MISFDNFAKALTRHRIVLSNLQIANLLNDLLPNPQSGFGVDGVQVWGDSKSIDHVRRWHHAATVRQPAELHVDGHDEADNLAGDGEIAPFYIFDATSQSYLPLQFPTRVAAQSALDWIKSRVT